MLCSPQSQQQENVHTNGNLIFSLNVKKRNALISSCSTSRPIERVVKTYCSEHCMIQSDYLVGKTCHF